MGSAFPTTLSDVSLAARWQDLRATGRAALVPYITAGFPGPAATSEFLRGAEAAGADVVELGIPWSDPVADGPVIQASTHAALAAGMSLERSLGLLADARPGIPVIVFSYLNPILAFGPTRFAERAREAGAAGLLVTDLPVGADPATEDALRSSGLPLVRLVAPTTTDARAAAIARASEGFIYLIARLGVTGRDVVRSAWDVGPIRDRVAALRRHTSLPIAVGFGISEPRQAAEVARVADGVVIGSALVEKMKDGGARGGLGWLASIGNAMRTS